ncbi:MAG: Arc family DNA-binding protein [Candidatus Omnitrophica bacterium]|nr:Arc family DNA-binding protein [Candidatus Omnitrophota bacterium]
MSSITIKNIPPQVHERLKKEAQTHHRSLQQEIIFRLERSVPIPKLDAEKIIKEVRALRSRMKGTITAEEIDKWKREGRE